MAVGVAIFIFLLVLQSCESQASNETTGSTTRNITYPGTKLIVSPNTNTNSSSTTTITSITSTVTTRKTPTTATGQTELNHAVSLTQTTSRSTIQATQIPNISNSAEISTFSQTADRTTHLPSIFSERTNLNRNVSTPVTMQAQTTLSNGSQTVSSRTTNSTYISEGISTVDQTVTVSANRTTRLSSIFSQSTTLNSNASTTITSSTLLLTTVSKITSPAATKDPTNETQKDKGNEKETKDELGYDRDLVIIFGTMLSLMLVAGIGYGIFKCKRRQKSRQFIQGGGPIEIATSKF